MFSCSPSDLRQIALAGPLVARNTHKVQSNIEMCAEDAKKTLALPEVSVPVNVFGDRVHPR
jgi:hypothetical protein